MKKILIFYGAYGGGHLSAAKAIKEYLDTNYKEECETMMIDCIEYINKYLNKISTTAYKEMAKKAPWIWKRIYNNSSSGTLSKITTSANHIMSKKLDIILQEYKPDLIISTHPFSNQMCTNLKKQSKINCKIATVLTDFEPHSQWTVDSDFIDYYFVSNQELKKSLYNNYNVSESKIFVTGIPISNKFKQKFNKDDICKEFDLDPHKEVILFFAGGEFGLGRKRTHMIFRALIRLFKNTQVIAISGRNKKMYNKFKNLIEFYNVQNRIKLYEFTTKVPELMSISKLVITKPGGLTTSESLVSNLPILIINPIPGQEEENAEFLKRNNLAFWIKKNDNGARILKDIYRHPEKLEKIKQNISEFAKPNSTEDICTILMSNI